MTYSLILILACSLIIACVIIGVFYQRILKAEDQREIIMPDAYLRMSVEDVLSLINADHLADMDFLIEDCNVERKLPAFYEKYQALNKVHREKYFDRLLRFLSTTEEPYLDDLYKECPELSTQDLLLLLLGRAKFENKMIAQLLFISLDTLKKRKTRLRAKMRNCAHQPAESDGSSELPTPV